MTAQTLLSDFFASLPIGLSIAVGTAVAYSPRMRAALKRLVRRPPAVVPAE